VLIVLAESADLAVSWIVDSIPKNLNETAVPVVHGEKKWAHYHGRSRV
jgi:hypothetical protein